MVITNNDNKQEDKINCSICARNGFANERIIFKSGGVKPDGSKACVLHNYELQSERHIHKPKQTHTKENNTNSATRRTSIVPECQVQYLDTIGPVVTEILSIVQEVLKLVRKIDDSIKFSKR